MRLVSFVREHGDPPEAGIVVGDHVVPAPAILQLAREELGMPVPPDLKDVSSATMETLMSNWSRAQRGLAAAMGRVARSPTAAADMGFPEDKVKLAAPLARPPSIRDFYAFEEHVQTAWERRGEPVPEAWYEMPVFYFSNPAAVYGPDQNVHMPRGTKEMDFEFEVAWVVGRSAHDLGADGAESAIVGLTIMNDWSARDIQRKEMSVGLGPAKAKDFATSLGPAIVTLDDLQDKRRGKAYGLEMTARVNGEEVTRSDLSTIHWGLGDMTAHASRDATLQAGDVLGTGTVGGGSILDLGTEQWLQPGDVVELEVERLGVLRNRVAPPRR